jgi:hypothetical protein
MRKVFENVGTLEKIPELKIEPHCAVNLTMT